MALVSVRGVAHVGIRVHDLARSMAFYEKLGFEKTIGPVGPEPVAVLVHPSGIEINLVLNASSASTPNVLMDVPDKAPGITHIALVVPDAAAAAAALEGAGARISGGLTRFPNGAQAAFVRDPDGVVIELHQLAR